MKTMRALVLALAALVLCAGHASGHTTGQATGQAAESATAAAKSQPATTEEQAKKWAFSASAYTYFLPEADDYVQPTFTADRASLHLEARYNYEDLATGSVWLGFNFAGGEKIEWTFTPMVGGVFGGTDGVAPGYKGSLGWRKLELYSEGEYVFDTEDSANSFFYNWSEVTFAATEWFRFGIVGQRTRAYQSDRDIQRGLLVAFTYKRLDVAGYLFNPDDSQPIVVVALRIDF
jgi:hypothetical protein